MKNKIKEFIRKLLGRKTLLETLKERGLKVGKNFFMNTGCQIDWSHCWLIEIGDDVTLAANVIILAHDASTKKHLGYTKIASVKIGNNVFVGAGAIILPGVVIGNNVIIGAGSVVSKSIPDNKVALGIPARIFYSTDDYIEKERVKMNIENCFDESFTLRKNINTSMKQKMMEAINKYGEGFVE